VAYKKDQPSCSVVIRAFNEAAHLPRLLDSIGQQTLKNVEIVLVDSGSTDATLEIAGRYPVRVEHIRPEDFTFGRSLNIGIRAASRAIVVMASAHVLPLGEDWLERLIAPFADQRVAVSYGQQRGGEGSRFSEDQHWRKWFPEQSRLQSQQAFCNNANAAIRRSLWEQHPYDEELTGLEDIAWASWALEQGYTVAYVAEAGVAHLHDETPRQIVNRHRREAIALREILPASRFSLVDFASQTTRHILSDLAAARREGLLLRELRGIFLFRICQYYGTYRGYHEAGKLTPRLREVFYYSPSQLAPPSDPEKMNESQIAGVRKNG